MARIWHMADGSRVLLTDDEEAVIETMLPWANFPEHEVVIRALKAFGNADKVIAVLRLRGRDKSTSHVSYTLCPIIYNIGQRTPEQYVEDVNRASAAFNEMHRRYFDGEISLAQWDAYLRSIVRADKPIGEV